MKAIQFKQYGSPDVLRVINFGKTRPEKERRFD